MGSAVACAPTIARDQSAPSIQWALHSGRRAGEEIAGAFLGKRDDHDAVER